ncbi:hypothetical protein EPN44_14195 [bacterium]|nr:MAG: hypothetical protein EPN44_14195 [bacterium]
MHAIVCVSLDIELVTITCNDPVGQVPSALSVGPPGVHDVALASPPLEIRIAGAALTPETEMLAAATNVDRGVDSITEPGIGRCAHKATLV